MNICKNRVNSNGFMGALSIRRAIKQTLPTRTHNNPLNP